MRISSPGEGKHSLIPEVSRATCTGLQPIYSDSSGTWVNDGEESYLSLCVTQRVVARCHLDGEPVILKPSYTGDLWMGKNLITSWGVGFNLPQLQGERQTWAVVLELEGQMLIKQTAQVTNSSAEALKGTKGSLTLGDQEQSLSKVSDSRVWDP